MGVEDWCATFFRLFTLMFAFVRLCPLNQKKICDMNNRTNTTDRSNVRAGHLWLWRAGKRWRQARCLSCVEGGTLPGGLLWLYEVKANIGE